MQMYRQQWLTNKVPWTYATDILDITVISSRQTLRVCVWDTVPQEDEAMMICFLLRDSSGRRCMTVCPTVQKYAVSKSFYCLQKDISNVHQQYKSLYSQLW